MGQELRVLKEMTSGKWRLRRCSSSSSICKPRRLEDDEGTEDEEEEGPHWQRLTVDNWLLIVDK